MTLDSVSLPAPLRSIAERRLEACREALGRAGGDAAELDAIGGDTLRVWASSEFVAQSCCRYPAMLRELLERGALARAYEGDEYGAALGAALEGVADEEGLMRALRHFKRREMVRIAWRDIAGLSDFSRTVAETSAFADAVLGGALERLYRWEAKRLGTPTDENGEPEQLIVFALGKLGAAELNFSSDIDLIFAFPSGGPLTQSARALSKDEFFLRLGRRLIKTLSAQTAEGFVFRVDMRLRPFGESGPLVASLRAMEDYYEIHGRDWERYALIRARAVAGDVAAGEALLERLRPFIYRRYLDFGALESLRDMKGLISAEVTRKGMQNNIKLGPGGIREIEFIGQAFQLVRGGRVARLRNRQILTVLDSLAALSYLPQYAVEELGDAYRFLRTVEHRLQQHEDQQVHALPLEAADRARLAAATGFADWSALERELGKHRTRVQSHFDQVFGAEPEAGEAPTDPLASLWDGTLAPEEATEVLAQTGFRDAPRVLALIGKLKGAYSIRALGARGRRRMSRLVPVLLRAVAQRRAPFETLERLLAIIEAIARRSVYLALLVERPLGFSQLVRLCEASPMIARQIARQPMLLAELLDARSLYSPADRGALASDLDTRLAQIAPGDTEQEMDCLRQFKESSVLRVAAADVSEALTVDEVSARLSDIAEVVLQRVLTLAWRDLCRRYGAPHFELEGERRPAPFAIVAYGKLGSAELGYGSDLDLVFLHGSAGAAQRTDGVKPVDNAVFFARLAQRIIHFLTTHTTAGVLYACDARLRPSGSKGLLVTSLESFEEYQLEQAWTWEHQALVRARAIAGDEGLAERFGAVRTRVLSVERDPEPLRARVREMRDRMRAELSVGGEGGFDLKQDAGGIADIEFMVQYGALRWASALGPRLRFRDNIRLLESFAETGMMARADASALQEAYRRYRERVHALALQEQPAVSSDAALMRLRDAVVENWRGLMGA